MGWQLKGGCTESGSVVLGGTGGAVPCAPWAVRFEQQLTFSEPWFCLIAKWGDKHSHVLGAEGRSKH